MKKKKFPKIFFFCSSADDRFCLLISLNFVVSKIILQHGGQKREDRRPAPRGNANSGHHVAVGDIAPDDFPGEKVFGGKRTCETTTRIRKKADSRLKQADKHDQEPNPEEPHPVHERDG